MLGLPELLILDEPTNGLDPPQIAAMRPILRRYAETGRTVVVSSHMLAEVEMTCTHVVVMHAGRVVTRAEWPTSSTSDDTTILDLPEGADPPASRAGVHARSSGTRRHEVRLDTASRLVVVADRARVEVVSAAVAGWPARRRRQQPPPSRGGVPRGHLLGVGVSTTGDHRRHRHDDASDASDGGDDGTSLVERLRQVRAR